MVESEELKLHVNQRFCAGTYSLESLHSECHQQHLGGIPAIPGIVSF